MPARNMTVDMRGMDPHRNFSYSVVGADILRTLLPQMTVGERVPGLVNGSGMLNSTDMYDMSTMASCILGNGTDTCNDTSRNLTGGENATVPLPLWQIILLGTLAGATSIMTVFGNLVVILSFILERQIRQPTNYFIASLAVSDLLIGSISMPFYTVYLLAGQEWPLGEFLCDIWLSIDYTVCLTSIYTVFCITIDRFCSVKIPAKYRNWRTDRKVLIMIACTWIIPIGVFFTSIIGWQYFVGSRSVPKRKCYVQYMEDALFNCILQVGYFWITLVVMCVLYTGIYKVALKLQRKSDAKHKKMTSLVSMAGQTMTKIGIGMSQQQKGIDAAKLFPENGNTVNETVAKPSANTLSLTKDPNQQGTSTTSFSSSKNDKEEDRSSSPTFPSDTEPSSSQSPKRSPKPKKPKKTKHHKSNSAALGVPKLAPPKGAPPKNAPPRNEKRIYKMERHLPNAIASNGAHGLNSLSGIPIPRFGPPPNSRAQGQQQQHEQQQQQGDQETIESPEPSRKASSVCLHNNNEDSNPVLGTMDNCSLHSEQETVALLPDGIENPAMSHSNNCEPKRKESVVESDEPSAHDAIAMAPELLAGVRYIDQDSLKSLQSNDNIKQILLDTRLTSAPMDQDIIEEPQSPIWKKRPSFYQEEEGGEGDKRASPDSPHGSLNSISPPPPSYCQVCPSVTVQDSKSPKTGASPPQLRSSPVTTSNNPKPEAVKIPSPIPMGPTAPLARGQSPPMTPASDMSSPPPISPPPANVQVHTSDSSSKPVSTLAKADDINPLNANTEKSSARNSINKKEKRMAGLKVVPYIRSMRRSKKSKKKDKKQSKSENRARKALRTITIILGAFVLCWTPWHILSMIIGFCKGEAPCVEPVLYDISYWLCYLNSPINPFCYAFANQQFKKAFIRILKLDWHRT